MPYETLISAEELYSRLGEPGWVVVDCRFDLAEPSAGRRAYRSAHLPGAYYAHLDEDLSGPVGRFTGRHPLPAPEVLARRIAAWGVDAATQVVAYDDRGGAFAARLWWLLRWLGHDAVAVLDGGLGAWRRHGYPLDDQVPPARRADFVPNVREALCLDSAQVEAALSRQGIALVDARESPRFRGEHEPIDPVAGHIPGARNLPFAGNLDDEGCFLAPAALRSRLASVLGDQDPSASVHMCGSGVTACHNLLAMAVAGLGDGCLYAGSWSEWIRDPHRPVARGED
ncbi:MAG TPA: sulfurtransferase [Gammaproteobacteria bacterium]|nr:sulfurtransferase [Gammaproteobacteria bacterium]